jgi:Cu-Zn family superoxide dismutase
MKVLFALFALFSIVYGASVQIGTVYLKGTTVDPGITGTVTFTLLNATHVSVTANVQGIATDGERGMHIHTFGDLSSTDGSSAGAHWDPLGTAHHSCPPDTNRHMGDMGNWTVASGRISGQTKELDIIALTGSGSIIGRAVVLHGVSDDCTTQPAGGTAPPRAAYGVIGLANPGTGNTNDALAPKGGAAVTAAICILRPTAATGTNNVAGTIFLNQTSATGPTTIWGTITGLDGNPHGFHIHEFGDVSNVNGTAAGAHYNPLGNNHGIPPFADRHIGDMGNIFYYVAATASYNYTNDIISLTGDYSVLGHTIIVHSAADDCGQPTGNAGVRLAQCVIGVRNPNTVAPTIAAETPTTQDSAPCNPPTTTSDDTSNLATSHTVSLVLLAIAMILAAFF